ncbi:hypothetical protein TcG_10091 [Trypanosoma cruzi]|nr:hypothetical protein TcG_10091 [Trypanosoma cruzi]
MAGEFAWPQPNRCLGAVSDRSEACGCFLSAQECGPYTLGEWMFAWTPHAESVEWNDYPQGDYLARQKSALNHAGEELAATEAAVRGQFASCARGGRTTWRRMGSWRLSFSTRWMRASNPADVLSMGRRSCDRPVFRPLSQSAPRRRQKEAKVTQCDLSTKLLPPMLWRRGAGRTLRTIALLLLAEGLIQLAVLVRGGL